MVWAIVVGFSFCSCFSMELTSFVASRLTLPVPDKTELDVSFDSSITKFCKSVLLSRKSSAGDSFPISFLSKASLVFDSSCSAALSSLSSIVDVCKTLFFLAAASSLAFLFLASCSAVLPFDGTCGCREGEVRKLQYVGLTYDIEGGSLKWCKVVLTEGLKKLTLASLKQQKYFLGKPVIFASYFEPL